MQEYEATFIPSAVDAGGTHLDAGQVSVQGVFFALPGGGTPSAPPNEKRFAITGGTGAYTRARGCIIEEGVVRTLEIDL